MFSALSGPFGPTLGAANTGAVPFITSPASLVTGTVGTVYPTTTFTATGTTPITWAVQSGTLPTGMSFSIGGVLSGTPTVATSASITFRATNAFGYEDRVLTLAVSASSVAPTVTTTSLTFATVGTAYSFTLSATGTSPITWTLQSGTLPAGLSLSSAGVISGTPTVAATTTGLVFRATNSAGFDDSDSLSLLVNAAGGTAPTITSGAPTAATVGRAWSHRLEATGTPPTVVWSLTSGTLPSWMNFETSAFNAANGSNNLGWLWGTPAVGDITAGINLVFSASNGVSPNASTGTLTFSVVAQPVNGPTILSTTLPVATVGTAYSFQLYAKGQPSTFTWAVTSGNKPGWMTVSSSGLITGTPAVGDITNALIMTFSCTSSNGTANTGNMGLKVQAAGGYALIQPSDFTYVGYYDVYVNGLDSPYTQGLTVRRVGAEVRLIQYDNAPRRFIEISLAGKTPATSGSTTANQITSTTRTWADGIIPAGYQWRDYARLYWDNSTNVLWVISAVNYPDDIQDVTTNIFTSTLTDGTGQTNVKRYSLDGVPDRRAGTGVIPTPSTFQSAYGVGPFVVGLGGYNSRVAQRGEAAAGLSAYTIPNPSGYPTNTSFSTAQYKSLAVRASNPPSRQLTVVNNEFDPAYQQPNPDGLNYWGYLSRYVGGFFVDGATKKGFVTIATTAKTRTYYYVSSVEAYGYLAEAHVYDPNDLGRISQGIQSSRIDPIAANMKALTETTYTGLVRDQFLSDAAYDDANKKLYVLMNGQGPTGYWNRIYVYDVNV